MVSVAMRDPSREKKDTLEKRIKGLGKKIGRNGEGKTEKC